MRVPNLIDDDDDSDDDNNDDNILVVFIAVDSARVILVCSVSSLYSKAFYNILYHSLQLQLIKRCLIFSSLIIFDT